MKMMPLLALLFSFASAGCVQLGDGGAAAPKPEKKVALLFDDGPHENGAGLVDLFKAEGVVGNFAYIGKNLRKHPHIAQSAVDSGWQILCHSSTHVHIQPLDDAALREELIGALPIFEEVVGFAPDWYWPPFGERDERMHAILDEAGMTLLRPELVIMVSTRDWDIANTPAELILERALGPLDDPALQENGDLRIILFHEWRNETLQVMPQIIKGLKEHGYDFVQIKDLMALAPDSIPAKQP